MESQTSPPVEARNVLIKTTIVAMAVVFLCLALSQSTSDLWIGIWLASLIYVALPAVLFVLRDLFGLIVRPRSEHGSSLLLLHVCAAFAFLLGYGVYKLSVWSEHPMVDKHRLLPFLFAAIVYGVPAVIFLRVWIWQKILAALRTEDP